MAWQIFDTLIARMSFEQPGPVWFFKGGFRDSSGADRIGMNRKIWIISLVHFRDKREP